MDIGDLVTFLADAFIETFRVLNLSIARFFGYPKVPGMVVYTNDVEFLFKDFLLRKADSPKSHLPMRRQPFPPYDEPEDILHAFIGCLPKVNPITRTYYESTTDGFYSFYIQNFKNIYTLPTLASQYVQINLNYCLDLTDLELLRQVLFFGLVAYAEIVMLRITLGWFLTINPYTFPLSYFIALVDWTEDVMAGFVPVIFGVNLTSVVLMMIMGRLADFLNNLVFTMPYLPGEGAPILGLVDDKLTNVLVFRYLPVLWYKFPIPNVVREYWYTERPDILRYMQRAYSQLDIPLLPDEVLNNLN